MNGRFAKERTAAENEAMSESRTERPDADAAKYVVARGAECFIHESFR